MEPLERANIARRGIYMKTGHLYLKKIGTNVQQMMNVVTNQRSVKSLIGEGGLEFEKEMAKELGLKRIVGSGSTWHSKLDLKGFIARWSLKFTKNKSFVVDQALIDEAVYACEGPGGDGSVPLWLFRLNNSKYDMIMIRKNDFKMMQETYVELLKVESTKAEQKRKRASVPQLFRDE